MGSSRHWALRTACDRIPANLYSFISPDGVEGFNFEGGIDDGDLSPTKKTKIKRGRATPPQHKLPILFF